MKKVAGLILAAGKSERMGRPKALLPFRGSCFLTYVLTEAAHSELTDVKVVLGHHGSTQVEALMVGVARLMAVSSHRHIAARVSLC